MPDIEGVRDGVEMTQALYAHMNNKTKKNLKKDFSIVVSKNTWNYFSLLKIVGTCFVTKHDPY
jgi:hypothetical protein